MLQSAKERIAEIQEELEHQNGDYDTLRTDYETVVCRRIDENLSFYSHPMIFSRKINSIQSMLNH